MKILSVLLMTLSLSLGCISSATATSNNMEPARQEMPKQIRKAPRHHRAMSMAMMNDLKLSDTQKVKWKEISEKRKAELGPIQEQLNRLFEQERKINEKYENQIKKILTDEQIKKYEAMLPQPPKKMRGKHPMPKKQD